MNLMPYNPPTNRPRPVPLTTLDAEALEVSESLVMPFEHAKRLVLSMRFTVVEVI